MQMQPVILHKSPYTDAMALLSTLDKSNKSKGAAAADQSSGSGTTGPSCVYTSTSTSTSASSSSSLDEVANSDIVNNFNSKINSIEMNEISGDATKEVETDERNEDRDDDSLEAPSKPETSSPLVSYGKIKMNGRISIKINGSSSIKIHEKIQKSEEKISVDDDDDDSSSSSDASILQEPEDVLVPDSHQDMTLTECGRQDEESKSVLSPESSPDPWNDLQEWGRSLDVAANGVDAAQAMRAADTQAGRDLAAAKASRLARAAQVEAEAKMVVEAALSAQLVAAAASSNAPRMSLLYASRDSSDDDDDILLRPHPMLQSSPAKETPKPRQDVVDLTLSSDDDDDDDENKNGDERNHTVPMDNSAGAKVDLTQSSDDDNKNGGDMNPIVSTMNNSAGTKVDLTQSSDDDDDMNHIGTIDNSANNNKGDEVKHIGAIDNSAGANPDSTNSSDDDDYNNYGDERNTQSSDDNDDDYNNYDDEMKTRSSDDDDHPWRSRVFISPSRILAAAEANRAVWGPEIDGNDDDDDENSDEMDHIDTMDSSAGATNPLHLNDVKFDSLAVLSSGTPGTKAVPTPAYTDLEEDTAYLAAQAAAKKQRHRNTGRCNKCDGCQKQDCGQCHKCVLKVKYGGKGSRGACVFRPCARSQPAHQRQNQPNQKRSRATMTLKEEYPSPDQTRSQDASMLDEEYPRRQSQTRSQAASILKPEGGHREHLDGGIAPVALSSKLGVGSRCYSKFNNGQWYWGFITKVSGKGHYARYAVDYDDGDTLGDIPWTDICSEKQYKDDFNEEPRPPPGSNQQHSKKRKKQRTTMGQNAASLTSHKKSALSLLDLRRRRCRQCLMCNKEDCGMCRSCQSNKGDTSIHKQVCLLKVNWPHHCYVCFCFYFRVIHFSPQSCRSDVHGFYPE
jgi:hypothetical protein